METAEIEYHEIPTIYILKSSQYKWMREKVLSIIPVSIPSTKWVVWESTLMCLLADTIRRNKPYLCIIQTIPPKSYVLCVHNTASTRDRDWCAIFNFQLCTTFMCQMWTLQPFISCNLNFFDIQRYFCCVRVSERATECFFQSDTYFLKLWRCQLACMRLFRFSTWHCMYRNKTMFTCIR